MLANYDKKEICSKETTKDSRLWFFTNYIEFHSN